MWLLIVVFMGHFQYTQVFDDQKECQVYAEKNFSKQDGATTICIDTKYALEME